MSKEIDLCGYRDLYQRENAMLQAQLRGDIRYFTPDPTPEIIEEFERGCEEIARARKQGLEIDGPYD